MRRVISAASAAALVIGIFAGPTLAGQPANPGCMGRDRAAWIQANSGEAWGDIAPTLAGDNGTINQAYKTWCGGDPTTP
jgi:hypothetical protein